MKLKLLVLIVLLLDSIGASCGKSLDVTRLMVYYDVRLKILVEDKEKVETDAVLEIGNQYSSFFSKQYRRRVDAQDSINAMGLSGMEMTKALLRYVESHGGLIKKMPFAVYKHYPEEAKLTYTNEIFEYNYIYEQELPAIDWQMQDADSVVCGYSCSKAVGEWRGRTWTVWYSMDIPIDDGPWKLQGLPGLILHAEDGQGDFIFTCVSIEEKRAPIILWGDNMRKCTPEWFQREITEFWKDQSGYVSFRNGMPKPDYSNTDFRPQSFTPCLMENYK